MKFATQHALAATAAALFFSACATAAPSQTAQAQTMSSNSIQPETTLTLNGRGSVDMAPDMATVSVGVSIESETASAAMAEQAKRMNEVFKAVKAAGVADKDMQTSNLSLNPVYDYPKNSKAVLRGYNASNQITIVVRDLDKLGAALDAVVKAGSNQINGVSFGVSEPDEAQNTARTKAVEDATRKAELYAKAAGYKVRRIVTISESEYFQPQPMAMSRMAMAEAAPTPIAAGEVSLSATVNVVFELSK